MKYKKIITGGCSFSDPTTPYTWPNQLQKHIERLHPNVTFDHRGLSSQGQDLIQKKTIHAIYEAMKQGYKPEDICVFVMWSSSDRKSYYIDHRDFVDDIVDNWKISKQGWQLQFGDLKNQAEFEEVAHSSANYNNAIRYNTRGGWFITSSHTVDNIKMYRDMYLMGAGESGIHPAASIHHSIEHMIMLQSFCKSLGIKIYQQFFMDIVREDFEVLKNHQLVEYLYKQLDLDTFILPESSIHGFLKNNPECFKDPGDPHPNGLGHRRWLTEVMLPHIIDDDFFK